jgi:hypothetical protein
MRYPLSHGCECLVRPVQQPSNTGGCGLDPDPHLGLVGAAASFVIPPGQSPSPRTGRTHAVRPNPATKVGIHRYSIVLRALAISMVVVVDLEIWGVGGGEHLLLGIAGFTFARFQLSAIQQSDRISGLARSTTRLAVPSVLFMVIVVVAAKGYSVANIFLVNHYFGPPRWTETWNFWFVEALVRILLAMLALLAIRAVRQFERRHSLLLPALLLAVGLLVRYEALEVKDDGPRPLMLCVHQPYPGTSL